jgi:hypothetical protein
MNSSGTFGVGGLLCNTLLSKLLSGIQIICAAPDAMPA